MSKRLSAKKLMRLAATNPERERQFIAEKSKGATKEKALAALAKFAAAGDVED